MKPCPTCKSLFKPRAKPQRYCAVACRPSMMPTFADGRRKCLTCGLSFTRAGSAQRYCSSGCRKSCWPEYRKLKAAERRPRVSAAKWIRKRQAKRLATALALREQGLTLAAIGERMGLTRQRVHQVLAAAPDSPTEK